MRAPRHDRRGLTLIELTIAIAIAALAVGVAVGAVNSLTDAALRSSALELSGTIKSSYDRAIMNRRTQRLSIDIDKGVYALELTEDPFALARELATGNEGVKGDEADGKGGKSKKRSKGLRRLADDDGEESFFSDPKAGEELEVRQAIEGGKASAFTPDTDGAPPKSLPSGVKFSKVWAGSQEEAFTSGTAYIHFFSSGWSEPALIELTDGDAVITLKVYPLTGRVRMYDKELEVPKAESPDGREEGDE
ncbi:prepilin-type N-terminal cleavage/methylation domain-containing protein [Myxococcota bacterium]|nr:prepilin-type N-terminal cleavage/methylation domain-containing protein [Myxococcota bacterium]